MSRGYSSRGVCRGLLLAMFTAALWISWSAEYAQACVELSRYTDTAAQNRMVSGEIRHPACKNSGDFL